MSQCYRSSVAGGLLAMWLAMGVVVMGQDKPRVLRFAAEMYPPFEFLQNGSPTGINVEVTSRIMTRLGIPFEFKANYPFARVLLGLNAGKVDAAPSVAYHESREPYLLYTKEQKTAAGSNGLPRDYLWITEYVFFINRRYEKSLRFESYEQIARDGLRVGIIPAHTYDSTFRQANLKTHAFTGQRKALRALVEGKIDLLPMDRIVGNSLARDMDVSAHITTLAQPLFRKPYLMVFSKASTFPGIETVARSFDDELRKMRDNGEYAAIRNRYLPPAYPTAHPHPLLFVAEEWAPYEYLKHGTPVGINVDVLARIMGRLNIPYEIKLYPWSRAWMLMQKGQADAVLSLSYKSTREDILHYTDAQRQFAVTGTIPPDYLWVAEYVFFVKRANLPRLHFDSYDQIKADGYRVGTNKNYSYHAAFLDAQLSVREYPDTDSGMRALMQGDIDLYPMDKTVGTTVLSQLGFADGITFLPKPLFSKPYLAPFSKLRGNAGDLRAVMDAFYRELRCMRETGEYDHIVSEHQTRGVFRE